MYYFINYFYYKMSAAIGVGVATGTVLDFLADDIARPDLFEQRSTIGDFARTAPGKPKESKSWHNLFYTIGIILLSAAIFISAIAWVDVLRSWIDSKYINEIIKTQVQSRLYYAVIITIIGLLLIGTLIFLWYFEILKRK